MKLHGNLTIWHTVQVWFLARSFLILLLDHNSGWIGDPNTDLLQLHRCKRQMCNVFHRLKQFCIFGSLLFVFNQRIKYNIDNFPLGLQEGFQPRLLSSLSALTALYLRNYEQSHERAETFWRSILLPSVNFRIWWLRVSGAVDYCKLCSSTFIFHHWSP